MKFRIQVQDMKGDTCWETYDKEVGQAKFVRGYGEQPMFTGDIQAGSIAIVEWFNKNATPEGKRRWLVSEMLPDDPQEKPGQDVK